MRFLTIFKRRGYASGQTSKLSDLDVAVLGEKVLELELLDLMGELQEIFEEEAVKYGGIVGS
jgi:predicted nucleotidyltransferase